MPGHRQHRFNVRRAPIVGTPEDALRCFTGTEQDACAVGKVYMTQSEQDPVFTKDYATAIELD